MMSKTVGVWLMTGPTATAVHAANVNNTKMCISSRVNMVKATTKVGQIVALFCSCSD